MEDEVETLLRLSGKSLQGAMVEDWVQQGPGGNGNVLTNRGKLALQDFICFGPTPSPEECDALYDQVTQLVNEICPNYHVTRGMRAYMVNKALVAALQQVKDPSSEETYAIWGVKVGDRMYVDHKGFPPTDQGLVEADAELERLKTMEETNSCGTPLVIRGVRLRG